MRLRRRESVEGLGQRYIGRHEHGPVNKQQGLIAVQAPPPHQVGAPYGMWLRKSIRRTGTSPM
jgi:hypothetical protein